MVILDQESSDITRVCSVYKNDKHPDQGFVPEYESLAVLGKLALNKIKGSSLAQVNKKFQGYISKKHLTEKSLGLSLSTENEFSKEFKNPTDSEDRLAKVIFVQ